MHQYVGQIPSVCSKPTLFQLKASSILHKPILHCRIDKAGVLTLPSEAELANVLDAVAEANAHGLAVVGQALRLLGFVGVTRSEI